MHSNDILKIEINNFILKKKKEKKLKLNITNKLDLFLNEIFDSLDFSELNNILEKKGYVLDISMNDFRIPRTINEIIKVFVKKKLSKNSLKLSNKNKFLSKFKAKFKNKKISNLIIHSNFVNLLKLNIKPQELIDFILEIYPNITIYAPGGFYDNKKKFKNNINIPNNEFGIFSKRILEQGKIFRNDNPFDNLIGFNKIKKYFKNKNIVAYGIDSPYRKLLNMNTYVMLIDVDFYYNSMFHMSELDARVPYRSFKQFLVNKKKYVLYARKKADQYIDYSRFGNLKNIKNISLSFSIQNTKIIIVKYKKLFDYSLDKLKKDPNFLIKKK